jgi:hypothetical protein
MRGWRALGYLTRFDDLNVIAVIDIPNAIAWPQRRLLLGFD